MRAVLPLANRSITQSPLPYSTMVHPVIKAKRVYYCQRCLNHGQRERRKNHKPTCMYGSCTCEMCILVEKRRELNSQLHELEEHVEGGVAEDVIEALNTITKGGERIPNCQKCGQHGQKARLKGHKRACPYRNCNCAKCQVISERQKLMADQIKIRRRQRKEVVPSSLLADNNQSELLLPVLLPFPNTCDINALLYKQLQQRTAMLLSPPSPTESGSAFGSSSFGSCPSGSPSSALRPSPSPDVTTCSQQITFLTLPLRQPTSVDEQFRLFLSQVRLLEQSMVFEHNNHLVPDQNVFVDVCTV